MTALGVQMMSCRLPPASTTIGELADASSSSDFQISWPVFLIQRDHASVRLCTDRNEQILSLDQGRSALSM